MNEYEKGYINALNDVKVMIKLYTKSISNNEVAIHLVLKHVNKLIKGDK